LHQNHLEDAQHQPCPSMPREMEKTVQTAFLKEGQACGSVGLLHHFILGLFAATN
jgi:hypothetical protein